MTIRSYTIAAVPGDGIGTEVVSAGIEVLQAVAARDGSFQFEFDHFDWGGDYYDGVVQVGSTIAGVSNIEGKDNAIAAMKGLIERLK